MVFTLLFEAYDLRRSKFSKYLNKRFLKRLIHDFELRFADVMMEDSYSNLSIRVHGYPQHTGL